MSTLRRTLTATLVGLAVAAAALGAAAPASAASPPTPVAGAPASSSSYYVHDGLFYLAGVAEGDIYSSLFAFDGTTFTQVPGSPVGPTQFHTLGDDLIFEAIVDINAQPSYKYGLFTYDGTTISQVPGAFESPNNFVSVGDVAYFQATAGGVTQLWQYDGTTASPVAGGDVEPRRLSTYGGKVYFEGDTDPSAGESLVLFSYDPATAAPAAPVSGAPAEASELVEYNGLAYFGAGAALYSFDGASTFTEIDIAPASYPYGLTVFGDELYFTGAQIGFGNVFSFDGTTTTKIEGAVTETLQYVGYNGSLYYLGFANDQPLLNVITDGTVSVVEGSPEYTFNMTVFQGKLYFTGDVGETSNIMYVLETDAPAPTPSSSPTPGGPALAKTGLDFGMPALAALALLLVGAAAAVTARARRA